MKTEELIKALVIDLVLCPAMVAQAQRPDPDDGPDRPDHLANADVTVSSLARQQQCR